MQSNEGARERGPGERSEPAAQRGRFDLEALTPIALIVIAIASIGAVVWGSLVADPGIQVIDFDAGDVRDLSIGHVKPFDELNFYLVGLADGRVRAVDGRVASNDCHVEWLPDDPRGREMNPLGNPGIYADPCSEATWAMTGDALTPGPGGPEALRTFNVEFRTLDDGIQHVFVEVIGRDPALVGTPEP